jgi:hypothetical protein
MMENDEVLTELKRQTSLLENILQLLTKKPRLAQQILSTGASVVGVLGILTIIQQILQWLK